MAPTTRRHNSNCPISFSLDLFGDRWTLVVLRDLLLWGKTRFAELQGSDEKIASNILSDRLRRLETNGFIASGKDPDDARQKIYSVTDKGLSLTPVLLEIAAWGASQDPHTGAPTGFAAAYYADREGFHREHSVRIAALFAAQESA